MAYNYIIVKCITTICIAPNLYSLTGVKQEQNP